MKVIIFSGLPGSGKSSYLERNPETKLKDVVLCEADKYFVDKDGVYSFNPSKLGLAHAACMKSFLWFVHGGFIQHTEDVPDIVAAGNTNTSLWEISPYVSVAQACNVPFEIIRLQCSVETSLARNTHNVPEKTIRDMDRRLKSLSLPAYWPSKTVVTD